MSFHENIEIVTIESENSIKFQVLISDEIRPIFDTIEEAKSYIDYYRSLLPKITIERKSKE